MALGTAEGYSVWSDPTGDGKVLGPDKTPWLEGLNRTFQNVTLGPEDLVNSTGNIISKLWRITIKELNKVYLSVAGDTTWGPDEFFITLSGQNVQFPSLAFDQLGKVLITWLNAGHAWLYWYNPITSQNEIRDLGEATGVTLFLDYPLVSTSIASDVVIFTLNVDGDLKYRLQSNRYDVEYDGNKRLAGAILFGGGLRTDNTVSLQYGYVRPGE